MSSGPGRRLRRSVVRISVVTAALLAAIIAGGWLVIAQPQLAGDSTAPRADVDPERLETHVRKLSETLAPRDAGHVENLDRVAAYIRAELARSGGRTGDQVYRLTGTIDVRNVIASFGPDAGPRVVVGAHYDTYGPLPGADDNASGVAGLIELAHVLGREDLPGRVDLVAYTLEEPPYYATPQMGSAVHARSLRGHGVEVRLMIALEMIGYFADAPGSQRYPAPFLRLYYPGTGNFVAIVGRIDQRSTVAGVKRAMAASTSLPVHSISGFTWIPGVDYSDHRSYWGTGYPAVMVTDTAFMRNRAYHTQGDTANRLDYERMAEVVEAVHAAVWAAASG